LLALATELPHALLKLAFAGDGLKSLGAGSGPRSIILAATTYSTAASLTASRVSARTKDRTACPTCVLPEPLSRNARDLAPAPDALTNRLPAQNPEADEREATARVSAHVMSLTV
jgi:hypothetical protein